MACTRSLERVVTLLAHSYILVAFVHASAPPCTSIRARAYGCVHLEGMRNTYRPSMRMPEFERGGVVKKAGPAPLEVAPGCAHQGGGPRPRPCPAGMSRPPLVCCWFCCWAPSSAVALSGWGSPVNMLSIWLAWLVAVKPTITSTAPSASCHPGEVSGLGSGRVRAEHAGLPVERLV